MTDGVTRAADVMWDVLVVGCGPGGAAAAIGARRTDPTSSVLMLDRQEFPRDKTCGDAVLGTAFERLAEYGVDTAALTAGFGPEHHLRLTSAGGTTVARPLTDSMTVLPRRVFDARLRDAALAARCRIPAAAPFAASVTSAPTSRSTPAVQNPCGPRVIVGADGAESVVRRAVGGRDRRQVAIALRGYDVGTDDHTSRMVLDDRRGLAYAWRFPSDDGRANVGYGHLLRDGQVSSRSALAASMHRLLPGLDVDTGDDAGRAPAAVDQPAAPWPPVACCWSVTRPAWSIPLPEKGSTTRSIPVCWPAPPRSSRPRRPQQYRREMAKTFGRHHRHVAVMSALSGRAALLEAGLRSAAADQRVFDDIAALALARGGITARVGLRHRHPAHPPARSRPS